MNRSLLLLLSLVSFLANAQTPITFNISDIPSTGQSQRLAIDTFPLPSVNFGSKGANQVYDFSNLTLFKYDTAEYRTPTNSQLTTCPNADVATTADGINFLLTNTDNANNKLILEGFEGQLVPGTTLSAAYGTKPDLFRFPTNYLNTFGGTAYLYKRVTGAQVNQPLADSVELTINTTYTDTIDGWGKVITPVGGYKCLRKQRKETTTTLIRAKTFFGWSTISNTTNTTIRYSYVTKEAKGSVINFNYDTANVLQSVNWSMTPPTPPVADFSFTSGAAGVINFTDLSDGYPTSWSWNFGDGSANGTTQNPSHTYATNGTYTVCLTASNAGGSSSQVCKQVVVSNAAVAPVANFSWANTSGGLVNFTDLSTNTPTSWSWDFGDGSALGTTQNPNHVYATNNTYNVCLIASNGGGSSSQVCKNVVVSGISAANNAPVAVDDTASVLQPNSLTVNVGLNDLDPDNDNFCVTDVYGSPAFSIAPTGNCTSVLYQPDSTFTGADTCWYVICDNGSPVLCDTGMLVINSLHNSSLLPTASFTVSPDLFDCVEADPYSAYTIVSTSINSSNLAWTFSSVDSSKSYNSLSVNFSPWQLWNNYNSYGFLEVCLTASNQFGSDTKCDTACYLIWESIHDVSLSGISISPNPGNDMILIDMSKNQDALTINFVTVGIVNIMGQQVIELENNGSRVLNINTTSLTPGSYYAVLHASDGVSKTLGRFVIAR